MIEWPSDRIVTEDAKRALELFKKSSFCAELSEDGGTWRFRSWARSPDAPARMVLRTTPTRPGSTRAKPPASGAACTIRTRSSLRRAATPAGLRTPGELR